MPTSEQLLEIIRIQAEIAKLGLDLGGVMSLVVERTVPLVGADGAAIELADGEEMVYEAVAGIASRQIGLRLKQNASLSGLCLRTGETLRCDDAEEDPRVDLAACRAIGLRSIIVMPLRHKDTSVGVLKAMSSRPGKFSDEDVALLGLLSDVIAASMFFATKYGGDNVFYRATHDGLTDLANRSLFMDRLRNATSPGGRNHGPVVVLMIDMDGLKQIDDSCGHRVGDAVIKEFADRIRGGVRTSDTVARLGDDEFAVMLTPIELPDGIDSAVQRLNAQITPPFLFEETTYQLRASIGAAQFPDDGVDVVELVEVADRRLHAAKQKRHGRTTATLH